LLQENYHSTSLELSGQYSLSVPYLWAPTGRHRPCDGVAALAALAGRRRRWQAAYRQALDRVDMAMPRRPVGIAAPIPQLVFRYRPSDRKLELGKVSKRINIHYGVTHCNCTTLLDYFALLYPLLRLTVIVKCTRLFRSTHYLTRTPRGTPQWSPLQRR
jgi:hypothetical protein